MRPALQAALQFALDSRRYDAILHLGRRPGVLVTAFDHSTGEPAVRFRLTFDLEVHNFVKPTRDWKTLHRRRSSWTSVPHVAIGKQPSSGC